MMRQVPAGKPPGTYAPTLPPDQMSLNEVYYTVQGECRFQGLPTVFVRASHCPLRCTWCDSKYTFNEGRAWTLDAVLDEIRRYPTSHVCVTGGEPLAQPSAVELCRRLVQSGYTVELETSGSEAVDVFEPWPEALRARLTVNLDVKCPGSAMTQFNRWDNLARLAAHDQLKFILLDRNDYDYAKDVLARHPVPCSVYLHPVWGKLDAARIAEWVKTDGLKAHVGIQLHKILWGDRRGV
jgi:7-carboxy-7-deazaguanine synthase